MNRVWWKCCLAEGVATFGLTLVAAGAICADRYSGGEIGLLGIAAAQGAVLAAMVSAVAPVSGGHVNPAITLALAANGAIAPARAALYVVAQLAGASCAGLVLVGLYTPEVWRPVALGAPQPSAEVAFSTGIAIEALLSFLLVFTALEVGFRSDGPDKVYGLAAGLVLVAGVLVGGPLTGAAMNPARAFGPALASATWASQAMYWIGPLGGGLAAAWASRILRPVERS